MYMYVRTAEYCCYAPSPSILFSYLSATLKVKLFTCAHNSELNGYILN